jgi:hypothetical protein
MEAAAVLGMPRSTLEDWEHQFKRALRAFLAGGKKTTAAEEKAAS